MKENKKTRNIKKKLLYLIVFITNRITIPIIV